MLCLRPADWLHTSAHCTTVTHLIELRKHGRRLLDLQSVYKLAGERLYATYFGGDEKQGLKPDEEAKQIWWVL